MQLRHRYVTVFTYGIGECGRVMSFLDMDMANIRDPVDQITSRQYVCMFLCVLSRTLEMLYIINKGCLAASSQLLVNLPCYSILALYHDDSGTRTLVLQHSIR
jgi:hypothetical protein